MKAAVDRAVAARQAEAKQCGLELGEAQRQASATGAVLEDARGV